MASSKGRSGARTVGDTGPESLISSLSTADFVRITASPEGDYLSAAGLLVEAFERNSTPYQVRILDSPVSNDPGWRTGDEGDAGTVDLGIGSGIGTTDLVIDRSAGPPANVAATIAHRLDSTPMPGRVLAGMVATGVVAPLELAPETNYREAIRPTPGIGVPTEDLATGLISSTMIHGPFSGDPTEVKRLCTSIGFDESGSPPADRIEGIAEALASLVAVEAMAPEGVPNRAGRAIERFLHPLVITGDPFRTVEGIADVIAVAASSTPGDVVAFMAGRTAIDSLLPAWKAGADKIHDTCRQAQFTPEDDPIVRIDAGTGCPATVARLCRDFRTTAPVVIVDGQDSVGIAVDPAIDRSVGSMLDSAGRRVDDSDDGAFSVRMDGTAIVSKQLDLDAFEAVLREDGLQ